MHHFATESAHVCTFLLRNGALWDMVEVRCWIFEKKGLIRWQLTRRVLPECLLNIVLWVSDDKPALVEITAWHGMCVKPSSKPMSKPVHWRIYVSIENKSRVSSFGDVKWLFSNRVNRHLQASRLINCLTIMNQLWPLNPVRQLTRTKCQLVINDMNFYGHVI